MFVNAEQLNSNFLRSPLRNDFTKPGFKLDQFNLNQVVKWLSYFLVCAIYFIYRNEVIQTFEDEMLDRFDMGMFNSN